MRSSSNTLRGVAQSLKCYVTDILEYDNKAIQKFVEGSVEILKDLRFRINNVNSWTEEELDATLSKYRNEKNLSTPQVNQPIRIALTGTTNSPSLGMTLFLFDKNEAISRIDKLINLHS